jgi:DNA polymerase III delta prime subunit
LILFHLEGGTLLDIIKSKSDTVSAMHAFLLIGPDKEKLITECEELAKKLHAIILEYPLVKIGDVRDLNNLIRLSFDKPTLIVCQNIHQAGEAALNAFLKNLEEPQKNIFFVLTAPSTRKVLPTIVSRCQVIKIANKQISKSANDGEMKEFMELTTGEKLNYIDKIKNREKAIELAESLVNFLHGSLHNEMVKYNVQAKNIGIVSKTLSGLKANGNVNLHLTNMVTQITNGK